MLDVVYGLIQGTNTLAKLEDNINLRKVMSHGAGRLIRNSLFN